MLNELRTDDGERLYRHVVIDEGQDFSPEMLRSLAMAIPPDGSLTFFGDTAQQIYGHRMSWRSAGLAPPKIWEFKENYRNTKQIAQLALTLAAMPDFPDDPDLVEPTAPVADGPLPALVDFSSESEEGKFAVARAVEQARTGTYHAAKGLEFDTVFLPFLSNERWPHPEDVEHLGDQEAAARDSRLLYVGITRARSTLVLTYSGQVTPLLPPNGSLYQQ